MEFAHGIGLFPPIGNPADVAFRLSLATECGAKNVRCVQQALVCYRVHNAALTAKPELTKTGELELCGWLQSKYKNDNWITQRVTFRLLVLLYQGDTNSNIPRREWARKQLETILQENQTLSRWFRLRLRFALSKHCKRRLSKRVFPWLSFEYTRSVRLRKKMGYLTKASKLIPCAAPKAQTLNVA